MKNFLITFTLTLATTTIYSSLSASTTQANPECAIENRALTNTACGIGTSPSRIPPKK